MIINGVHVQYVLLTKLNENHLGLGNVTEQNHELCSQKPICLNTVCLILYNVASSKNSGTMAKI